MESAIGEEGRSGDVPGDIERGVGEEGEAPRAGAGEPWTAPVPLGEVPAVPAFPVEALPGPLAEYARATARAVGCPVDFVGLPMLVLAGAAVGASRMLRVKAGWEERPALYGVAVGRPGSGKSAALWGVVRPVLDEDERRARKAAKEVPSWVEIVPIMAVKMGIEVPSLRAKHALCKRVAVGDVSIERMAKRLRQSSRGVLAIRDDMGAWLRRMQSRRAPAEEAFYQAAWDGKAGARNPGHVFLAVAGTVDAEAGAAARGRPAVGDRTLDRWLAAFPDDTGVARWQWDGVPEELTRQWFDVLAELGKLEVEEDEDGRPGRVVELDEAGREAWAELTVGLAAERARDDFPEVLAGTWAKLRTYGARLALIVHCLRRAQGDGAQEPVDGESVRRAGRLVAYFGACARKLEVVREADPRRAEVRRVLRWIERERPVAFRKRDAFTALRGTFGQAERLDRPLETLERHGYVRAEAETTRRGPGRRASVQYVVNPLAWAAETRVAAEGAGNCA